jgi:hypothetical protein
MAIVIRSQMMPRDEDLVQKVATPVGRALVDDPQP